MRLYVALPVPDHVRALAIAARAPAEAVEPPLTWTRPEGWHVTLAFLGEVADDQLAEVQQVVGEAVSRTPPIGCHLGAAGRFADRALWLAVGDDPAGAIRTLGAGLQNALATAGLPVQRREVRAHLTLARRRGREGRVTDQHVAAVASLTARWQAEQVELVRSHLGDGPAHYEPVDAWALDGMSGG